MIQILMNEVVEFKLSLDVEGNMLDGGKNYCLTLPPNIPACNYWSIVTYSNRDNLVIRNNQPWPSIHSNQANLVVNKDGSMNAYFGPVAFPGKERNWIQTIPGEYWHLIMRLYDPANNGIAKLWKPGNVELSG